ncbi:hypothetical protein DMP23_45460 [Amycolatopsis sp. A1MSW2902]
MEFGRDTAGDDFAGAGPATETTESQGRRSPNTVERRDTTGPRTVRGGTNLDYRHEPNAE